MAEQSRADWRPPTDSDWRRLRTLLHDGLVHLEGDADMFDKAEQDLRRVGGESWSIGIGRYPDQAAPHHRQVPLDDRGMSPGTLAP